MTRSALVDRLHRRFPALTFKDLTTAVDVILGAITETLETGDRVEIRGFGVFHVNHRHPKVGRNPKSGETVMVPAKVVPHFKPGKELKIRVQTDRVSNNFMVGIEDLPIQERDHDWLK